MLISRNVTKEKEAATDFRFLHVKIGYSNLTHPLLKDTISLLESSIFEVMSVLDLK